MWDSCDVSLEVLSRPAAAAAMGGTCRDYIDCPHCKKKIYCVVCTRVDDNTKSPRKRSSGGALGSTTLSCRKCRARDGNEVEDLRLDVEQKAKRIHELEAALRDEKEKHMKALDEVKLAGEKVMRKEERRNRIAVKKVEKQLMNRLDFLELQVPRTGGMFEPEAVALAFRANPPWIWAHRHILVAKSVLFEKRLQNVKVENGYKYVAIRDTTRPIMQTVVNFCYTGLIQFNEEITPEAMLQVSHKYGIPYLKNLCDQELCKQLTSDNIGKLIKLAKAYEAKKLKKRAMDYLKHNFEVMRETVFEIF